MTKITSAIAATMVASASFATAALAEGNYYEGPSASFSEQATQKHPVARSSVSYGYAGSAAAQSQERTVINSGDYYDGANRPN
jgi:hypothetical protein